MTRDAFIVDAVRTPLGRLGGALAGTRPDDLAATAVQRGSSAVSPSLDPATIDEVYVGDANGAGEDNRNVGPHGGPVGRAAGHDPRRHREPPVRVRARGGHRRAAGRSRSATPRSASPAEWSRMTRAPWVMPKPSKALSDRSRAAVELDARLADDQPEDAGGVDDLPRRGRRGAGRQVLDQSREEQDEFALGSHRTAPRGVGGGWFAAEDGRGRRGRARRATSASGPTPRLRQLATLKPVFRAGGTVTAGNASPMNDGSAALLLASAARRRARAGRAPMARIVSPSDERRRAASATASARSTGRASALRPRRHRLGRPGRGRAERGVRGAEPGLPARVARARSGDREPAGWRHRHRAPARLLGRPHRSPRSSTTSPRPAAATDWRRCASAWARGSPWWWRTSAARAGSLLSTSAATSTKSMVGFTPYSPVTRSRSSSLKNARAASSDSQR